MATPSGSYKDESDLGRKVRERGRKRLQQQKFQQEAAAAAVSSSDLEAGGCKRKPLEEADLEKSSQPSSLEVHSEKDDEIVKSDNTDGEKSKDEAISGEEAASAATKSVIISNPTSSISAYGDGTMRLTDKSSAEKTSKESPLPEKTEGSPNDSFLEEDSIYGRAGEEDETRDSASDPKPQLPRPPSLMEQILKSYEAERGGRPLPEDEERERENEVEAAVEVREGDQVKFEGVTPAEAEHKRRSSLDDSEELELAVPRLSGFIESWPTPFTSGRFFDTPPPSTPEDDCGTMGLGFTLQKDVSVGPLTVEDSQRLMRHFDRVRDESRIKKWLHYLYFQRIAIQICREKGLDRQNYECADCSRAIGSIFGPAKFCSYSGGLLCEECHQDEAEVIPVKVVLNWDFRRLPVGHKAKAFLEAICSEPIVDAKNISPSLFEFAPELDDVLTLRKKLNYMSAYLQTCGRHPKVFK